MKSPAASPEPDLRWYLDVLRRRHRIVLVTVGATLALALALTLWQTPQYRAHAEVLVESGTPQQLFDPVTGALNNPERSIQNEIEFIQGDDVTAAVDEELPDAAPVDIGARPDADIIVISASSPDAELAADTANTYAEVFLRERQAQSVEDYRESARVVQSQLRELTNQIAALSTELSQVTLQLVGAEPGTATNELTLRQSRLTQRMTGLEQERTDLQATARQLQLTAELLRGGTATITSAASVPDGPYSPRLTRNLGLALLAGLVLGISLAFVREYFDDSVRTKEDVQAASGLSVLTILPTVGTWKRAEESHLITVEAPKSPAAEAYRSLRTAIQFMGLDNPLKVVSFTSSRSGEGKTTTVANLAVVLAQSGLRVLALDGDLRKPRLHRFFGIDNSVGFTTALMDTPLEKALHELPDYGALTVMPSGAVPPDPAELLASSRTDALFEELLPQFDMIIIDSPPVLPVTDALVLSRRVDAVTLVASARKTSKRELHRSVELLRQIAAPVIGTVFNDVGDDESYGYGGYGYGEDQPAADALADD